MFICHMSQELYYAGCLEMLAVLIPALHKLVSHMIICDKLWKNPTFCIFHQNRDFAILGITLCNAAITIANIEGGKLARADTQNGKC